MLRRRITAIIFAVALSAGIAVPVIASAASPTVAAGQPNVYFRG